MIKESTRMIMKAEVVDMILILKIYFRCFLVKVEGKEVVEMGHLILLVLGENKIVRKLILAKN